MQATRKNSERELPLYRLRGLQKGKSKLENVGLHAAFRRVPTYFPNCSQIQRLVGSIKPIGKLFENSSHIDQKHSGGRKRIQFHGDMLRPSESTRLMWRLRIGGRAPHFMMGHPLPKKMRRLGAHSAGRPSRASCQLTPPCTEIKRTFGARIYLMRNAGLTNPRSTR